MLRAKAPLWPSMPQKLHAEESDVFCNEPPRPEGRGHKELEILQAHIGYATEVLNPLFAMVAQTHHVSAFANLIVNVSTRCDRSRAHK